MTPGVSILSVCQRLKVTKMHMSCIRLAFEIFHYVEKSIINVWLVVKLHLDLVEIGESILNDQKYQQLSNGSKHQIK